MTTTVINTLQFANELKAAGVPEKQAETQAILTEKAIAEAVKNAQASAEIATKRDIAESKVEIIKWVISAGIFQTAIISALLLKLLPS